MAERRVENVIVLPLHCRCFDFDKIDYLLARYAGLAEEIPIATLFIEEFNTFIHSPFPVRVGIQGVLDSP